MSTLDVIITGMKNDSRIASLLNSLEIKKYSLGNMISNEKYSFKTKKTYKILYKNLEKFIENNNNKLRVEKLGIVVIKERKKIILKFGQYDKNTNLQKNYSLII